MSRNKRIFAMLLSVVLMLTLIPATVFAEESSGKDDQLVYNLHKREVTVSWPALGASNPDGLYFNEDGSYTIQLEDNAFFPYEVQFQYGGQTTVRTFDSPDSTVTIGGHRIGVYSEQTDDTTLSQIGVWIRGRYVAAKPEPKSFSNPMFTPFSLLPLNEVSVTLDLTAYDSLQLRNVGVAAIINGLEPSQQVGSDDKVVWARLWSDNQEIVEQADKLDLSKITSGSSFSLELIVGNALQLDDSNTRYIVRVSINPGLLVDSTSIYMNVGDKRTEVTPLNVNHGRYTGGSAAEYVSSYIPQSALDAEAFHVGLTLNPSYSGYPSTTVYRGIFETAEAAKAAAAADASIDVTDKLLNQDMSQPNAGVAIPTRKGRSSYREYFTFVFTDTGGAAEAYGVEIHIAARNSIYAYNLYSAEGDNVAFDTNQNNSNGVSTFTYALEGGFPADGTYYLRMQYNYAGSSSDSNRDYIDKAVLGHFDTLEAAASAPNIKDALFPVNSSAAGSGYAANYSGNGQDFTVFDTEGAVYKITAKTVSGSYDLRPRPGSADTYFQIQGANELTNVYVLPYEHDTYYDMGYQTLFTTDDVSLSSLTPTFWSGEKVHIYSGHKGASGTRQESGITTADFSKGALQYAAAAENKESLKNYWVTVVKQHTGGSKLFVNGINGTDGAKREVFLTSASSEMHDVFIANVGDESLTGLTVALNAKNVKLDPYWRVGGAGNDTLAAFTTTQKPIDVSYGELANVAKIRLLPDGEGEISGTLTISADGQAPVVITLTGHAGDPKLTTESIPAAVKYVPYGVQILHNNKYSWNRISMNVISGRLPDGVELRPNGELYGVPREVGEFTFEVEMSNSDTRFGNSYAEYTLNVLENTNTNVYNATDANYTVTQRVGTRIGDEDVVTVLQDYTFISDGEFGEFIDFWIDGEKLTRGVDYTGNPGSTVITIRSQTFEKYGPDKHTIAAEFRVGGNTDNELKRAAQNYVLDIQSSSSSSRNSSRDRKSNSGSTAGGTAARAATQQAVDPVAAAQRNAQNADQTLPKLTMRLKNMDFISLEELQEIAAIAEAEGKTPWLNVDTMTPAGNVVDVRVGVNPALAESGLNLAGSTLSAHAQAVKVLFERFFENEIPAVVSLTQKEDFGQAASICVKVPEGTDPADLVVYSYNPEANTYRKVRDPNAWVDNNGYLHFDTPFAYDLIVAKGDLTLR